MKMEFKVNSMRYLMPLLVAMILLVPSIVYYSPDAVIQNDGETEVIPESRSGPQTYQDDTGGWWMQDEEEDFEGGDFYNVTRNNNRLQLQQEPLPPNSWYWQEVSSSQKPNGRYSYAMAYDSDEEKIILFGGIDGFGHYADDTWAYNVNTQEWTKIDTNGPCGRQHHTMVYDTANKEVILFGGKDEKHSYRETWTFDTTTNVWNLVSTGGPSARWFQAMTYDSINNKIVLFGGYPDYRDTWTYDTNLNTWNQVSNLGPSGRYDHQMTFDPTIGKIILFGGKDGMDYKSDTWTYSVTSNSWVEIVTSGPSARRGHSMTSIVRDNRIILFGGYDGDVRGDLWTFNSISQIWTQLSTNGPENRMDQEMVYDLKNHNVILFGGRLEDETRCQDTWELITNEYYSQGMYTSPIITLPELSSWNNLTINTTAPENSALEISIIDSNNEEYVPDFQNIQFPKINLSSLNVSSINLKCCFTGNSKVSPFLNSWKVTWKKKIPKPEYLGGIPSNIPVTEDTPEAAILDLSEYFGETRGGDFTYGLESISDDEHIHVGINDSYLDVTYLEENWTGRTDLVVNCTNDHGESVSSDEFSIVVQRVDDAPAWTSEPPPISIDEDNAYTSDFSYADYLTDAENDMLGLSAVCDISNVTVQISPEGFLTVIPEKDYFGTGEITITASEIYNPALKAETVLPLTVNGINDDPSIDLLSPGDGAVYNDTAITLQWEAADVDTPIVNITCELYFGEKKSPPLHTSDITDSYIELDGLTDKTTYYWYVAADDGEGGKAASPVWSFGIDTESEVIPGDTGPDSTGDLNVTIKVDTIKIVVVQGDETTFNVEIKNDGEKTVTLTIVTSGDAAPCLSLNNFITLAPSESKTEAVKVTRTAFMEPGNYTMSLVFVSPNGMKYVSIPMWIKENRSAVDGPGEDDDDDGKNGNTGQTKVIEKGDDNTWLFIVGIFLFLVIFFLAVLSMIRSSKLRSRVSELESAAEREEVLEGEAYLPGKRSFQSEIEDRTAIPVSPGPYQPPELPGKPFEPRVATFQPQQVVSQQLPASQPTTAPESSSVTAEPVPNLDLSGVPGITPPTPPVQGKTAHQVPESLQTPIGPFVQLPQAGGTQPQGKEQKMLPEKATGVPSPLEA